MHVKREGYTDNPDILAMPIESSSLLDLYEKELQIQRGSQTGTTFLIPLPMQEIKPEAITLAVINEFYFPILRGTLIVNVNDCEISSSTIAELAANRSENLRVAAPYREFLDQIAGNYLDDAQPHAVFGDRWGEETKLSPEHLPDGKIQQLRDIFQDGKIVSAVFPLRVNSIKDGQQKGQLRVFLQEAGPHEVQELFVRQDLAVDKEKSLRSAKRLAPARALILIDDEVLSQFLAAAEEPTHREWNGSRPKLAQQYRNGAITLRLVRHAASRLLEMLVPPATKDALALASFFPDVMAKKDAAKAKTPKKKDAPEGTDSAM